MGMLIDRLKLKYVVSVPSDHSAGIRGFDDIITIIVESGDPGGVENEFSEHMRKSLQKWYHDGDVELVR